jgi:hypothetical protein
MKRALAIVVACIVLLFAARAGAVDAREALRAAKAEGGYGFCSEPSKPLLGKQIAMCSLAHDVEGCEGFARACDEVLNSKPKPESSLAEALARLLGPLAQVLAFVLVGVIVLLIAIPVMRAIMRARGDRQLADRRKPNVATPLVEKPPEPEEIADAEAALRMADEHARRGNLDRAIALYLAASLSALDHRGAIRIAKHRTNGEYVRACSEQPSRQALREIVREVDRAVYGKVSPTRETVTLVASRAASVVRAVALGALVVLACGCGDLAKGLRGDPKNDPAGDLLPMDVVRRSGYAVAPLETSLATLPMPGEPKAPSVVVVPDLALEDESEAHLMHWVEAGGIVVLMGDPQHWPKELEVKYARAESRNLVVDGSIGSFRTGRVIGARVAHAEALEWHYSTHLANLEGKVYAAYKRVGKGAVLGIANADLFTNVGISRPDNAAALVALLHTAIDATHVSSASDDDDEEPALRSSAVTIAVARQEDAIAPPSNPFSSLLRAGLGKAAFHALAACALLFLAVGIRQARPRPAAPAARRAFAEHVEATGAFYGRAKAYAHALSAYGRFVEMRLRERLPRGADPAAFLAQRAGISQEDAARAYNRATQAKTDDAPRGDELATIRDLRAMVANALET